MRVFGDATGTWVRTRRVWNEHAYHVTNVDEDGTIPANELPNWKQPGLNNFRQNKQPGSEFAAPDAVVSRRPALPGADVRARRHRAQHRRGARCPRAWWSASTRRAAAGRHQARPGITTKVLYPAESEKVELVAGDAARRDSSTVRSRCLPSLTTAECPTPGTSAGPTTTSRPRCRESVMARSRHDDDEEGDDPDDLVALARRHIGMVGRVFYAPSIPPEIEATARFAHDLHLPDDEAVLVLHDGTVFGSAEEGFLITRQRLCWKNPWERARQIAWRDLDPDTITRDVGRVVFTGGDIALSGDLVLGVSRFLLAMTGATPGMEPAPTAACGALSLYPP